MQLYKDIKEYSQLVCDQIRWRKARPVIAEEIENHLIDQKEAYIADGMDEKAATAEAIRQMGDPVQVGTALDRVHRPKTEWSLIIFTVATLLLGIGIKIFITDDGYSNEPAYTIIAAMIGIAVMMGAYFADFTIIGKFPKTIYSAIMIITFLLISFSKETYGYSVYAHYVVILFPLAYAAFVYSMRKKGYLGLILSGIAFGISAYMALVVPSFSELIVFILSGLIILCIAIHKNWFQINRLTSYNMVAIPTIAVAVMAIPYVKENLEVAFHPEMDANGAGYITLFIRNIFTGAHFIGQADVRIDYFPCMDTDFLLTYLIYRFGLISLVIILLLFTAFIICGFRLCFKQKSMLGILVSVSVMLTFSFQVILYILSNLGFRIISTGYSLPLVSYGCTSTVINMALIGIMLSVFKSGSIVRDNDGQKHAQIIT